MRLKNKEKKNNRKQSICSRAKNQNEKKAVQ